MALRFETSADTPTIRIPQSAFDAACHRCGRNAGSCDATLPERILPHGRRTVLTVDDDPQVLSAIRRDPRCSVVVTSTGTSVGAGKTVTIKARCVVHEDRETKDWFYPAFSAHLHKDEKRAKWFEEFLDSPLRIVLEVVPEKWITYDGTKMALDSVGKLPDDKKGPLLSSDPAPARS